jgi:hypothetical protein
MIRTSLAIVLCALLTACGTPGIHPDKVTIQTANMPTPVACSADPGQKPPLADPQAFTLAVAAAQDVFGVAKVYAAGHQEDADWIARLEAANAGCRAPTK